MKTVKTAVSKQNFLVLFDPVGLPSKIDGFTKNFKEKRLSNIKSHEMRGKRERGNH